MDSGTLVILIVIFLLFLYLIGSVIRIVPEYQRLVILALGRYAGTRGPGIVIVLPLLERAITRDMRESFLEIPRQTAISKDNAPINIDFLVYYRVVNPELSVIAVDNVIQAALGVAATTLRAVIGDITLDDVLAKRDQINDTLRVKLDDVTETWGLKVTRVEIREIEPPRDVQEAMNRQMTAERQRRALVTTAAGEREAAIARAEGERQASILKAEGEKQASILQAEGERQAQLLKAQGFAKALEAIYEEAQSVDDKTLLLQYLETLRAVGTSPSTKFVVPMEVTNLMQQFGYIISGNVATPKADNGGSRPLSTSASRTSNE
jgi:regulator of protease activity HflC (stomatin/prohibitin superfamily)